MVGQWLEHLQVAGRWCTHVHWCSLRLLGTECVINHLTIGAVQCAVMDEFEMIRSSAVNSSSLIPITIVLSGASKYRRGTEDDVALLLLRDETRAPP